VMAVEPRKTFSGRRRKARGLVPLVEGTGRVVRPPKQETVADVVSIVLAQPHRRGFDDARSKWHLESAVGRMIEAHPEWWAKERKFRSPTVATLADKGRPPKASLLEAAKRYSEDWSRYRAAVTNTRRPLAVTDGGTRIDDPERELKERRDAERAWADVNRALRYQGEIYERACHFTICDHQPEDWTQPIWLVVSMPIALRVLIQHYGLEAS
jgi:hypothetical protein